MSYGHLSMPGLLSWQARERATANYMTSESLAAALRPTINH